MKILNLGCGTKKEKGQIGLDKIKYDGVDVLWDLERIPLPFKDKEFDLIIANNILEHIWNLIPLMDELYRILKSNGILKGIVPHFRDVRAYQIDHKKFFRLDTFTFFKPKWQVKSMRIVFRKPNSRISFFNPIINPIVNSFPRFWEQFLSNFIPCQQIHFELVKNKNKRGN